MLDTNVSPIDSDALAGSIPASAGTPGVVYRFAGDAYLLVEYGDAVLDLGLRFRAYLLEQEIQRTGIKGVAETIPGVRSLLIKYNPLVLCAEKLVGILKEIEAVLPCADDVEVPSRLVHLPIAFHDRWTLDAIAKYRRSVRAEAPYLPDNAEFVARCNGLDNVEQVFEYLQKSQIMIIGLGDVYLGAPCAVSLDPRYRLEAPKYNPARTYTCEGGVGIGGAFLCIYPMESPGGYQLVGRTLPIWNTWQATPDFKEAPWLFKFFDRIQFHAVSEDDLLEKRDAMRRGDYRLKTEPGVFSMRQYKAFTKEVRAEAGRFKARQKQAIVQCTKGY